MCTVTIITLPGGGYRMGHARDELRSRAPGQPPEWRVVDGPEGEAVRVCMPIDPDAGGTWLGVTAAGLTLGLLNVNIPPNGRPDPTRSRGEVIPRVLQEIGAGGSSMEAANAWDAMDLAGYAPHRLIAVDRAAPEVVYECRWDGLAGEVTRHGSPAVCFASSGLGDGRVRVRLPLFDEMVAGEPTPNALERFHMHRWDERPEVSVLMSRRDARTVSLSWVDVPANGMPTVEQIDMAEGDPAVDPVGAALVGAR